jgi:hypothetical protein
LSLVRARKFWWGAAAALAVCGIVTLLYSRFQSTGFDSRGGPSRIAPIEGLTVDYYRDAADVLNRRCVVCHGCYDAPCQLELSALEGADRGATKSIVYDASRVLAAEPTRLFVDAAERSEWREKGFFPVLPESSGAAPADAENSLAFRMLDLKARNPLPQGVLLEGFQFGLGRGQVCPAPDEFSAYAKAYPLWGMPYGLPGLADPERNVLLGWLRDGARGTERRPLSNGHQALVDRWERFFNPESAKGRLVSRYLYEHLFMAHLYFDELPAGEYFELVRSRSAPGHSIDVIATRRPYDDPGVERVYYRLQRLRTTVLDKTHMPYALNDARRRRWEELFLRNDYEVGELPGYEPEDASNPFVTFESIPVRSRYSFLLDEARFSLMTFIKGPVCRGQVAVDVLDDRFWIFFFDPDSKLLAGLDETLARDSRLLRLPAEHESNASPTSWVTYAALQRKLLRRKADLLDRLFPTDGSIALDEVWNGEGENEGAALTVFRNFDSASVIDGLVGSPPKTAWVLDYPILERIHYLLVAGFDVFGNVGHQVITRLYMDFLRMEAEANFLILLPVDARARYVAEWYRSVNERVRDYLAGKFVPYDHEPGIRYRTEDPKLELYQMLRAHLAGALHERYSLSSAPEEARGALARLTRLRGRPASIMPELSVLMAEGSGNGVSLFSILRDSAHSDVTTLFREETRRLPEEDSLTVTTGIIGSYPNGFFHLRVADVPAFVNAVEKLANEEDYRALVDRFGVRRSHPEFWAYSDRLHEIFRRTNPVESGVLDFNRLENR